MADWIGQQLGNYRLARLLGQGGFAEVFLGEHLRLGTQAAVKVLYTHLADRDAESFLTEARTIARLEHPHIVRVLDFDVQEGVAFLIMSYAPLGNLRQHHPKGSRLPLPTIVDYVKQVTGALQYAHNEKIIHRDIKPENMLLGRHSEVLLSDFGIALIAQSSRLQNTQDILGTAHYMAPEQLQGKPRIASDQYALGVVVYEWLCGDRPFHGTITELYSQQLFASPPSLREKVPTIPPEVEQVVLTALEKDPHKRFASVQAFATALEQAGPASANRPVAPALELPRQEKHLSPSPNGDTRISSSQLPPATNVVTPPNQLLQSTIVVIPPDQSLQSTTAADQETFHGEKTIPHVGVSDLSQIATTPESKRLETLHQYNASGKSDQEKTPHQLLYKENATQIINEKQVQDEKNVSLPIPVTARLSPTPLSRSSRSILVLVLVGAALFLVISSLGLFTLRGGSQTRGTITTTQARSFATATILAQANAIATDSVQAAATSVAQATAQTQAVPSPTPTARPQAVPSHIPHIPNVDIITNHGISEFSDSTLDCSFQDTMTPCFQITNRTFKAQEVDNEQKSFTLQPGQAISFIPSTGPGRYVLTLAVNDNATLTVTAS